MSTKHLRRLLEEKEGQMQKNKKEKSSSESDKEGQIYPANRFFYNPNGLICPQTFRDTIKSDQNYFFHFRF